MNIFDKWMRLIPPKWQGKGHRILRDVVAMFSAFRDPRVPWSAKGVALASVAYLILPVDLIPDFIPVLGWMDDLAMIPLACFLAGKLVPAGVMERLRDDAEFRLMRWGPAVKRGLFIFIAVWLLMAAVGGCMMLTRGKEKPPAAERPDWEHRLNREINDTLRQDKQ